MNKRKERPDYELDQFIDKRRNLEAVVTIEESYNELRTKYENLQNSHNTLQKVVKSLLEKLHLLQDSCNQKDKDIQEYKTQLRRLKDANQTLNIYIQSSHPSVMNNLTNTFGPDVF
ncbi:uncharacterized protein CMU_042410 [Cryptosporidium muris RN66]|uniref:Uncharacterized protein n=1 Tax=Cryptosporidium muris (strain RN66) TaxID=441375 RepID=B6AAC7_CRYMR|nr:uncharacterized protein CMU_042410 [Cryptosporidium muris RN66]EEA05168.1 hypothetical protein, conserved [Cryptosporidium muris RN66]|eukprot:XP_002139517.1 hypothetical protein [Cryptosporidium muris RN66]